MERRTFLGGLAASALVSGKASVTWAQSGHRRLTMPPLIDAMTTGRVQLNAQKGATVFSETAHAQTWGFNQPFLGPTLRMKQGQSTQAEIKNSP